MEDKVRVYEVAEESGASSSEVIAKAADLSIILKSPQSTLTFDQAEAIVTYIMTGKSKLIKVATKKPTVEKAKAAKVEVVSETVENADEEKVVVEETKVVEVKETKPKKVLKKLEPRKGITKVGSIKKVEAKKIEEKVVAPILEVVKEKVVEPAIIKEEVKEVKPTEKKEEVVKPKVVSEEKVIKKSLGIGEAPLKRRKLTIVKKKRPAAIRELSKADQPKTKAIKSMSELFGNMPSTQPSTRVKKTIRKSAARSQDSGRKINVFGGRGNASSEFNNSQDSILGEEVMLDDMNLIETSKFLQEAPRQPQQIRTTRPSAFGNRPRGLSRKKKKRGAYKRPEEVVEITEVTIPEQCRVYEFAEKCGKTTSEVISTLFMLGMMVTKNDFLGNDEIEILGDEFEIEITIKDELEDVNYEESYDEEVIDKSNFINRPPVVTIMGHVDHGKTSLLDKIRSSRVAAGEAGGITQHISAYTVTKNGQEITFVDTPGHAAFSAMRRRGASITDVIILVVAADDGVKPQTIESIKAAKESGAPIIVAVNKMDKESANIDMVKAGMAEHDMTPADWGGDIEFIGVSAITGAGIDDLLENILIQSELLELQADPKSLAKATVLEASIVKGRGSVATVIVQNGTLKVGDNIVADTTFGRVKALLDDQGKPVKELGLSRTGQVVGLGAVPTTGVSLVAQENAAKAKEIATTRAEHARAKELSKSTKVSLEEMSNLIAEGKIKALPIIIKADAGGSYEAIKSSLEEIKNDEVKVKIIGGGVGGITEADLSVAGASDDCVIIGFNVRPTGSVKTKAKAEGIQIKTYSIIYDLIDDIKDTLSGMMSEIVVEENTGQAQVLETFVIPKVGTIAGTKVTDGKVVRGGMARLIRDGVVVYTGTIEQLKRFKDDVKEVANGFECGIMFKKFNDIKVGDYIETFIEHKEAQKV
ncbi:MAG: translation initiation factor IF-2 [Arcobacteraceae bacterium]|nr:translation initiation factor IF-2 [Arcobacteraceae bacterium]